MNKTTTSVTSEPPSKPVGFRGYNAISRQWYYSEEERTLKNFEVVEAVYPEVVVDQRDALITALACLLTEEQMDKAMPELGGLTARALLLKINELSKV